MKSANAKRYGFTRSRWVRCIGEYWKLRSKPQSRTALTAPGFPTMGFPPLQHRGCSPIPRPYRNTLGGNCSKSMSEM